MSLPCDVPFRAPTHSPVPPAELFSLAGVLAEHGDGPEIALETVERVAAERRIPASHALLAAPLAGLLVTGAEEVAVEVCGAQCQLFGASACLETLLRLRAERRSAGQPTFVVRASGCMNGCLQGPTCRFITPHGTGYLPLADEAKLTQALAQVLDGA